MIPNMRDASKASLWMGAEEGWSLSTAWAAMLPEGVDSGPAIGTRPGPLIGGVLVLSVLCVSADVVEVDEDTGAEEELAVGEVVGKVVSDFAAIILNISDAGSSSTELSALWRSRGGVGCIIVRIRSARACRVLKLSPEGACSWNEAGAARHS
jgi:hypothetical protein